MGKNIVKEATQIKWTLFKFSFLYVWKIIRET
jgi:hypothetical protein